MHYDDEVEALAEIDEQIVLFDGIEKALIGYTDGDNGEIVALYDIDKVIHILSTENDWTNEEAYEYFEYNILGTRFSSYTPKFATLFN